MKLFGFITHMMWNKKWGLLFFGKKALIKIDLCTAKGPNIQLCATTFKIELRAAIEGVFYALLRSLLE